ncbi:hypothetical protein AVO45_17005 [Ruegeria marisrubri]|uniref:YjiS-like domain-containing protein n=1 Tax=Ruegeria marisrubri TaxID=1685379 RepID=A0A0X3UAT4_9RHOB|nr:DUF1127 domain-containing protein [Ruegeria marisrubri]KUJ85205.1 hypothetical protein AVO45_17005 [Ruegeria marisrubri]
MADIVNIPNAGLNLWGRIRNLVDGIKQARARAVEYNRTYSELQSLSDRELNDIGIRRCDIQDIAEKHVYCR